MKEGTKVRILGNTVYAHFFAKNSIVQIVRSCENEKGYTADDFVCTDGGAQQILHQDDFEVVK